MMKCKSKNKILKTVVLAVLICILLSRLASGDAPTITTSNTSSTPSSIERAGAATTTLSVDFTDADIPAVGTFYATFRVRDQYGTIEITIADALQNGQGGLTITDGGGGSYTATIDWDPDIDDVLGYYDLYCMVSDGTDQAIDGYANNADELLLTGASDNVRPVVPSDNTYASPAAVERIGANPTTLGAIFTDTDAGGISAFKVSFKLREPDNIAEIVLADNVADGTGGVTIADLGTGVYEATISWDPADAQELGYYDLYFHVTDNIDTSYDGFSNNLDELQLYDAISNNPPTLTAGATSVSPNSVNRIGSEFTEISTQFSDSDLPGIGAFTITIIVRDQLSTEYTLVDAAKHKEQGLRVRHLDGANYEASFLWDPDVSQAIDDYDLYFYVQDNNAASAVDNYVDNLTELAVISSAIMGDGNLLHRSNTSDACGGATAGCHNLPDHHTFSCLDCHTAHETSNIYLIRENIVVDTVIRPVDFRTLGIGDPYNDPDPTPGIWAGAMADSTDNVFTGVCEVCHDDRVDHHRFDGSQPGPNHHDAEDCTGCHPHSEGFASEGESSGGQACTCHSSIYNPMNTSTTTFHHQMDGDAADYTISSKTCLTCHVDHDIFRSDLNVGFGERARNLRVDITTPVVQGDNTVLSNTDYMTTGTGGICLSCHTSSQSKGYTQPDGTTETPVITRTDYDAATNTHNYQVPSTFSGPSTFNANCVKCHNDNMTKSYQTSTDKFSVHNSDYRRILAELGLASPADPHEEDFCFQCHSTTSNPNAGTNQDYYGVQTMSDTALAIESLFGYTYSHPTTVYSGRHQPIEDSTNYADGNRHAECADCHNPHAAQQGTHDGTSNLVSNALKGVFGVDILTWPDAPTDMTDNANKYATIQKTDYTEFNQATKEYQICLKCHSNYTTLPAGSPNIAEEINPNYPSTHAIAAVGDNAFCDTATMNEPWGTNKINYCSDCHRSDTPTDPEGPHGSNADHLLVAPIVSNSTIGTPLCDVCHKSSVYWSGDAAPSDYDDHPATQGQHYMAPGCFSCHMWDHSSTASLGLPTDDWPGGYDNTASLPPPIKIWVHGQNRNWVYNEQDGTAGTTQPVENFINGFIANMDHGANRCWTETCKVHSNKAY
jgi:hypothetical protein